MISKLENSSELIAKTIGQNIQFLRKEANMSRKDLSKLMNISYQQLYKFERGQNKISAEQIVMLKFVLGASYNELFKELY